MLEFTAAWTQSYGVRFLPNLVRPMILNRERRPVRQAFTAPGLSCGLRPSALIPDADPAR